jgi:ligand-binding sensor domain-containing protein
LIKEKYRHSLIVLVTLSLLNGAKTFERLTARDGLSDDIVRSISDDKNGFIWIGTDEGLNRFFRFNNPNVKDQCGCGESFTV